MRVVNKQMTDFQIVSRRQVELAIWIRMYRRYHQLSQNEFAKIATIHGHSANVKFHWTEISKYENYRTIPTEKKLNVLLAVIGITLNDLN